MNPEESGGIPRHRATTSTAFAAMATYPVEVLGLARTVVHALVNEITKGQPRGVVACFSRLSQNTPS